MRILRTTLMLLVFSILAVAGSLHTDIDELYADGLTSNYSLIVCTKHKSFTTMNSCMAQRSRRILNRYGIAKLGESLDSLTLQTSTHKSCHFIAHPLGFEIGTNDALTDKAVPTYVSSTTLCSRGLTHGILMGYLNNASLAQLQSFSPDENCPQEYSDTDKHLYSACTHGFGHAAFTRTSSMPKAYDLCLEINQRIKRFGLKKRALVGCAGGVAMQAIQDNNGNVESCGPPGKRYYTLRYSCLTFLRLSVWLKGDNVAQAQKKCLAMVSSAFELSACHLDLKKLANNAFARS